MYTEHGDFAAYYTINLEEDQHGTSSIPVTVNLMKSWGVTETIHADATAADKDRCGSDGYERNHKFDGFLVERSGEYLLNHKLDMETIENPMFCLTNENKMNGASLLLQEGYQKTDRGVPGE